MTSQTELDYRITRDLVLDEGAPLVERKAAAKRFAELAALHMQEIIEQNFASTHTEIMRRPERFDGILRRDVPA